jgi:serine phosphatase RsbU (regulator of sigma subunit)
LIEWGVAALPLAGEAESGDLYLVKPFPYGVLVAVVDGLGHGPEAALAAKAAVAALEDSAPESVIALLRRCHERLMKTRGVVMSLAFFSAQDSTLTWVGVGNVEGVLVRADAQASPARESVLLRGGVLGYEIPSLHASVIPVARGDTLILSTDGIRHGFAEELTLRDSPQQIADRILAQCGKDTDDALVLVARYLGGAP